MATYPTFSEPFLRRLFTLDIKILRPRVSLREHITDINNQYVLYSRTCSYESSILEGVYFTVSYEPVSGILSLRIIIAIASAENLIIFVL